MMPRTEFPPKWNRVLCVVGILAALILTFYFRTYTLQSTLPSVKRSRNASVEKMVAEQLREQIIKGSQAALAQIPKGQREEALEQKVRLTMLQNPEKVQSVIDELREKLYATKEFENASKYLVGSDSYYYLNLTDNIIKTGKMGQELRPGRFYNPLRRAPRGTWDRVSWHPYVGAVTFDVLRIFFPDITLMKAVAWVPLLLTAVAFLSYLLLITTLAVPRRYAWFGLIVYLLSPVLIQRSQYGWYDTDIYNMGFPVLILFALYQTLKSPKFAWYLGLGAGILTGIYSMFWSGWSYMLFLMFGAGALLALIDWLRDIKLTRSPSLKFLVLYLPFSLIVCWALSGDSSYFLSILNGFAFLLKTQGVSSHGAVWPNMDTMVGETKSVSLEKWVYMTASYVVIGVTVLGGLAAGWSLWRKKQWVLFQQWFASIALFAVLTAIAFVGARMALFGVLPFSIVAIFSAQWIGERTEALASRLPFLKNTSGPMVAAWILVFVLIVPRTIYGAFAISFKTHVIMDDNWYQTLTAIKEETPKDTIVFSWWSPGYFVNAIADRRAALDGGSQGATEHYWVAVALTTENEREACGIFRMLTVNQKPAVKFLEKTGMHTSEAVALILELVQGSRAEAEKKLPAALTGEDRTEFLNQLFGKDEPDPAVIILYDQLIEQNVMIQAIAKWQFEKVSGKIGRKVVSETAGNLLRYESELKPIAESGGKVFFEKGIIVDVNTHEARIKLPFAKQPLVPVNLYYEEDGVWKKSEVEENGFPFTVMLLQNKKNEYQAVLAQSKLFDSLLFRLQFFNGKGLKYIKPFESRGDYVNDTLIRSFTLDWDALKRDENTSPQESMNT